MSSTNFDPCIPETGCGNQTSCTSNYTGIYGSYGPTHTPIDWSGLYGINAAQGGWAVQIYDCIGVDVGALTNASITFTNLSTTCGGSSFISYNSGMISSAINDNSCSAATASIFEVPLATLGPGITIDAIVNTLWTSNTSASITNPIDLNTTANNLPVGTTEFTLVTNILYGNAICTQTATTSVISTGGPVVPEFDGVDSVCLGQDSPLPLVSDNGVVGVWTPAFNNTQTETYTFIPDEGQCAEEITLTVTVNPEIEPTFNPIFPICQGDFLAPNTLPTTSLEGITGSWSPALNNQVTTTYTFTPHPDQCAIPTTLTIEVTPKISPTFSNIRLEYCQGDTMQPLPLMSNNSPTPVLGTWFPPLNNQQTTTYTFVPAAGQCANQVQVTIAIKPYTTPQFIPVPPICAGDFLAPLPNTSINGITGSWSPALNNMETTTYTFTPTMHSGSIGGQCGEVVQMTIVVNQPAVPAFNLNTNICAGTDLTLPTISNNGIEGSWSPAFDNTQTTTYTFTPNPDECAEPFVVTINVNDPVTPTFNPVADICAGANLNPLPTTSLNGVSGTWSPALNNQATTTYTFTPNASECAVPTTLTIVVDQPIVPLFDQVASTCSGDFIAPLPTTSNNGITGTWSPALNYNQTTTYTFTPTAGICATEATMTITVTQPATPVFAQVAAICAGEPLADLPTTSEDGITGTWSPAIDNTQTTTYTFTPDAGQCTLGATMTITVNPWVQPVFSIGGICVGADSPLPNISDNGVTGTWSPDFDNTQTGTYTFTPDPGQCGLEETVTVTVVGSVTTPTLTALEYCDPNSDGFGIFDLTQVIPIIEGVNTVDVDITFHETEDDALFNANNIEDLNPLTAYPNIDDYNQTIYVRISNDSGCFAVIPLELIVYDLPKITKTISPLEVCDDDYDGSAEFNLADALSDIMNGLDLSLHTISYHPTQNDASLDENAIGNFANYDSASGSVWVRVEDDQTGCFDVVELTLVVNPLPVVSLPEVERYVLCDDDQDGYMIFDLESRIAGIVNGQAGLTISFHDTYADAESNTAAYEYLHQNNEPTVETVFVRVQTQKGCFVITLMDLVVEPLPVLVPAAEPIAACDGDGDGLGALIDFTATIEQMLNGADPDDYVITLHETYDDAQLDANAIADTTAYMNIHPFTQIVYLRVETILGEGCFNIYPITIQVTASPQLPVAQDGSLPDLAVCDDNQDGITHFDFTGQTQYVLDAQADVSNLEVTYHLNEQNAVEGVLAIATVTHYQNLSNPQTLWVRLENTLTGCFDVAPFDLIVNLPLELPVPPAISVCDEDMDGNVEFDLTIRIPAILANANNPSNFTVEFFTSYADAVAGDLSERIDTPESYWLSTHVHTLGIRVTNNTTGCQSYTIMDIRRLPMPNVTDQPLAAIEGCQDPNSPDGIGTFDLTDREDFIRQGDTNLVITYHLSEEEAQNGTNAIATPDSYTTTSTTIYIRVANPSNAGVSCAVILSVELIIHPLPLIADTAFEVCEVGSTGYAEFYFPDFNADLLGPTQSLDDFNIAYYLSLADAENQTGAINQSVAYSNTQQGSETLWVRVTHLETGCSIIEEVTLYAEEAAQATQPVSNQIFECDYDGVNDGITSGIDLTVYQSEILNGQDPAQFLVAYHTDEYEAHQGLNAVANPSDFTNTVAGGQTIWVRVINSDTNAPCYALATLEVIVEELPNPVITADNDVLCIPFGQSSTADAVVLQSSITQAGYTYAWYHNGSLVAGATQSSLTLDSVGEEGMYSLVVTSPNGCVSDASEEFEVFLSGTPELVSITTTNAFQDQQDIIVTVQGYGEYAYQLNDGPLQDTGHFTNVSPGVHTITVYDISLGNITQLNSCDSLVIDNIQLINYPKFFTPNGDGYNDNWNITGLTEFHNAEIYIFDRYGKLLKQLNPTGEGWDGTFNGNQLPSTDYWFKVLYDEEDQNNNIQRREFKAHFSLKR